MLTRDGHHINVDFVAIMATSIDMKLAAFLLDGDISYAEFARRIGARHRRTVERYAKGQRQPNQAMMASIVRETMGAVQPNDFFDLPVLVEGEVIQS